MNSLMAVVLACGLTTAQADCTPDTALDIVRTPASSSYECLVRGQAAAASVGLPGEGNYIKVRCERRKDR